MKNKNISKQFTAYVSAILLAFAIFSCNSNDTSADQDTNSTSENNEGDEGKVGNSEIRVEITKWNKETNTMDDLSFTSTFQYAEVGRSLYVTLSDKDLGDDYLTAQPADAHILQIITEEVSDQGTRSGDYQTTEDGKGMIMPILNGNVLNVCCGFNGKTNTSGKIRIDQFTQSFVSGTVEVYGFDSTTVKCEFKAPIVKQ